MAKTKEKVKERRILPYVKKAVMRTRQDIADWVSAVNMTENPLKPKNFKLQDILKIVAEDDMVLSQSANRSLAIFSRDFVIKNEDDSINEEETKKLKDSIIYRQFAKAICDAENYYYTLAEMEIKQGKKGVIYNLAELPRRNTVPQMGQYYPDLGVDEAINYRDLPEYNTYIFEFIGTTPLGLYNACTPKVLIKKFAFSCWGEYTEIHGNPPVVLKTNTQDKATLDRAEEMLRDMGASARFIIDESETFEFAQGVSSNGDIYNNLISNADNAIQNIISGAIVGQDTKNGSNSKEINSQRLTDKLIESDLQRIQLNFNTTICDALYEIGFFEKEGLRFEYLKTIDLKQLWAMIKDLLGHKKFTNEYLYDTFGIVAEDIPETDNKAGAKLNANDPDFFA